MPWEEAKSLVARIMRTNLLNSARWIVLLLGILSIPLAASQAAAEDEPPPPAATSQSPSKFRSAEDGWLDISGFLDERYGFIPLVIPITEPNEKLGIKRSAH